MPMVVILLGAPGAGKGTQARRLAEALSLPHIATGDLFRENIAKGTEVGRQAEDYLNSGELVPDDLVIDMLFDRVAAPDCAGGYLLDGFPRTLEQARTLEERIPNGTKTLVANIAVADDKIIERITGRLLCRDCDNIHHSKFAPPRSKGICDACGGELYNRPDDDPQLVKRRLDVFHAQTQPLEEHYEKQGRLVVVDGEKSPSEVFKALLESVGEAA